VSLRVVTPPDLEALTIAETRTHLRVDQTCDSALLALYIDAARVRVEHELQRSLVAKTYELTLDKFPTGAIELPEGPIPGLGTLAVLSVKYTDGSGIEQTVDPATYIVDAYSNVPTVTPASGWPTPKAVPGAVRVRYTSGASSAAGLPAGVKAWMLLAVGAMHENREELGGAGAVAPMPFAARLLDPYRSFR
jgi:uncharacterized phiE125 gp8 family phage protein